MLRSYRELGVWQKAMALVTEIYRCSQSFPKEEMYGLSLQIRRCAVSIPSNIAEGYGRNSTGDYIRFLQIATGSLYELQTQIEISSNLGYLSHTDQDTISSSLLEIERMLNSLTRKLQERLDHQT